jgi:hypothetical protein
MLRGWKIFRSSNRVYRGRNTLISGAVWIVIANAIAVGAIVQDPGSTALVLLAVGYSAITTTICWRLMWSGIFVMQDGIHVANIFSSYDVPWASIERFEIGSWKINRQTCIVQTRDGRARPANGLQESTNFPNGSAEKMVDELNRERPAQPLKRQSPSPA